MVYVCFTCGTRTNRYGTGSSEDPYVVAGHNTREGESCDQSGARWVAWAA